MWLVIILMRAEDRYPATRRRGHLGDSFPPTVAQCPRWRRLPGRCFARPAGLPSRRLWCVEHTRPGFFLPYLGPAALWVRRPSTTPAKWFACLLCLPCLSCLPALLAFLACLVLPTLLACLPCLPCLSCLPCLPCLPWLVLVRPRRAAWSLRAASTRSDAPPLFRCVRRMPVHAPPPPCGSYPHGLIDTAGIGTPRVPPGTPGCPPPPPSLLGGFSLGGHPLVPVATSGPARRIFPWRAPLGAFCHSRITQVRTLPRLRNRRAYKMQRPTESSDVRGVSQFTLSL